MTDGILTSREAAKRLHVSLKTVHRMAADGRLSPADKWPGYHGGYLFDETEVDELAATPATWPRYSKESGREAS